MDRISDSDSEDAGSIPAGATTGYFAYIVKSLGSDYLYKGHCQNLEQRLKQHNQGLTRSLRPYLPVVLVYFEEFPTLPEAIAREKYFKSAAGRRFLKAKLAPYFNARPTEH